MAIKQAFIECSRYPLRPAKPRPISPH